MNGRHYPAKVVRPQMGNIIPRLRLFEHLKDLSVYACVWVAAPPGSGKTTLVNSWADEYGRPCLWYQIDPRDANPATFFHYLGLAAAATIPSLLDKLPALTPEYLPGLPIFARNYFELLYQSLPAGCMLVFDNYQELPNDSPVHGLFEIGLESVLPGISVIIVSRTDPPRELARCRANGLISQLPARELNLTDEEARAIVAQRSAGSLSREQIVNLLGRARGWVAGLILLLEHTKQQFESSSVDSGSFRNLFDYFAGEVLTRMQPEKRGWLYRCALLPRMTSGIVSQLCAAGDAGDLLDELDRDNYFIYRYPGPVPVYQFHPLFREFLLSEANEGLTPNELQDASAHGAYLLEADGAIEDAVELYIRAGEWEQIARLALQHAQMLVSQGRNQVLAGWIGVLPEAVLDKEPWLRCWQGYCHLPYEIRTARELFERAYRDLKAAGDTAGAILAWSGLIDTFQLGQGRDGAALDRWIAEARAGLLPPPQGLPPEIEAHLVHAMLLALVFREPGRAACREWADRAETCLRQCPGIDIRVRIALVLMLYRLWMGNYAGARLLNEELRSWLQRDTVSPLSRLTASWARIMCEWMTGSPAEAVRQVESGIRLGRETGVLLWERIILGHGVEAALTEGDTATAAPWLQELEDGLDPQLDWDYCQYHHLACLQALLQGEAARAREHARRNFSAISGNAVLYLDALCRLDLVESLRTCGELSAAAAELKEAWKLIEEVESRLFHFMACMCEASLALDTGEEGMALDALHKGLAIGRESDIRNCWSWRSTVMQRLCVTALENGVEVPYVQSLITERNLIPDKPPQAVDGWPWPVRIRTLGEFSMQVYGKSLDFTGKAQKKPLELLKVLLALGGREVPLRRLEETVWPDAEGDAAHRSFGTALHRLRKLLGGHDTLVLEPNTLSLNPRYCQVDSWVCERILGELDRALQMASDREVRKIGRELFKRYRGPFLRAETDAAWVLAPRERLQRRMLRSALKLGRYWEARQDWQQAADVYSRGLNIESRNGTLCQRLMLAYRNQGLRPEAMLAYRQYRDSLPESDEPLPAILALYETIANGRASRG